MDRTGHRPLLLIAAALLAAAVAWVVAGGVGLLLQPRFTALELAAQRLAPDDALAQPPVEQVRPGRAFDRRYVVTFPAEPGVLDEVTADARRRRWMVVDRPDPDAVVLERGGVLATVTAAADQVVVRTRVAPEVRVRHARARRSAALGGGLGAPLLLWSWLRRRPRLRVADRPGRSTPRHGR